MDKIELKILFLNKHRDDNKWIKSQPLYAKL